MLVLASRTLEGMQYLGAVLLRPAGVGVDWLRRQDDIEVALAVRRRRVVVAAAGEEQGTCGQCTRWRASCSMCSGCLLVIMQRQVLQSCRESVIDVGVVPLLQFIDRVFFLVVNRDRYSQLRFFSLGFGVLQYIDKVVDVPGDGVALWRLVKEFHIFSTCCSRCSPGN